MSKDHKVEIWTLVDGVSKKETILVTKDECFYYENLPFISSDVMRTRVTKPRGPLK